MITQFLKDDPATRQNETGKQVIRSARRWHIEYCGFLSNHVAHQWAVLAHLGRPEAALQAWRDTYTRMHALEDALPPLAHIQTHIQRQTERDRETEKQQQVHDTVEVLNIDSDIAIYIDKDKDKDNDDNANDCGHQEEVVVITAENLPLLLGNDTKRLFCAFLPFFDAAVSSIGIVGAVQRFVPVLLPGMLGAAMHPIIHLGLALEVDADTMVAEGLAYLASAYNPLAMYASTTCTSPVILWTPGRHSVLDTADSFFALHKEHRLYEQIVVASTSENYANLPLSTFQKKTRTFCDADLPFSSLLKTLFPMEFPDISESLFESIEQAAVLATAYFLGSKSEFFVIHVLTSLHAVIVTSQYLPLSVQRDALAHWLQTALVALSVLNFVGYEGAQLAIAEWKYNIANHQEILDSGNAEWWQAALDKSQQSTEVHISKAVFVLWRFHCSDIFSKAAKLLFFKSAQQQIRESETGNIEDNIWFM